MPHKGLQSHPPVQETPIPPKIDAPQPIVEPADRTVENIDVDVIGSIQEQLNKIREQALAIQTKAKTLAAEQTPSDIEGVVSSSEIVVQDENNIKEEIARFSQPSVSEDAAREASENVLNILEEERKRIEERRKQEIERIRKEFEEVKAVTEKAQEREFGGFRTTLARIGGFLGPSASAAGALTNLAQTHRTEISALEAKKSAAIQAANNASSAKQFQVARLKANEVKELEQEINDRRERFFTQTLQILQEQRLQEAEDRQQRKATFENMVDIIDRISPTLVENVLDLGSPEEVQAFVLSAANDLNVDPALLQGKINDILLERSGEERKQLFSLSQKYIDAGIDPQGDSFADGLLKIRNSESYKRNVLKVEADIANTKSLIAARARAAIDKQVDFSDPILSIYTAITGKVVTSQGTARGIIGYAESLLENQEIVANDFTGPLLDNQIRESDARKKIQDAFGGLSDVPDNAEDLTRRWLGGTNFPGVTPAAQMTVQEKIREIMQSGLDPKEFGFTEFDIEDVLAGTE